MKYCFGIYLGARSQEDSGVILCIILKRKSPQSPENKENSVILWILCELSIFGYVIWAVGFHRAAPFLYHSLLPHMNNLSNIHHMNPSLRLIIPLTLLERNTVTLKLMTV